VWQSAQVFCESPGFAVWSTAPPWQLELVQDPLPNRALAWHSTQAAGTAGLSMRSWQVAQALPACPTFSDAIEPLWQVVQSASGTAFASLWW
jgi:hypothetical protein